MAASRSNANPHSADGGRHHARPGDGDGERKSTLHLKVADQLLAVPDARMDGGLRGPLPSAADAAALAGDLLQVLFPSSGRARSGGQPAQRELLAGILATLEQRLIEAVYLGLHRRCRGRSEDHCREQAESISRKMLQALPSIRELLVKDVEAALDSDPAATGPEEVIACYPGLYAIAIYRAAHQLLQEGALIIPRMLTEHAKSHTGIDIHPGATIGPSFFIDHGTGIVIGETTTIGAAVRIYQGVTLGALSIKRRGMRGDRQVEIAKRHPTIEDDVIIYANATILGGDTVIGRGAVIGGNSFITYSVPPGIRVGVGR
ncbi:MAG TPA: serine O-acetyltransferase [Polyangia bacterium]